MNSTIQHTTDKLTGLLPDNQQYYKLEDLRTYGFPDFIVERIRIELERNLTESKIKLPDTDWADMQSEAVQKIWKQFIDTVRNEVWLPASYAGSVIETAVADILRILVEPRKNIPKVIFGTNENLTAGQVDKRIKVLVVYRHFARLLPRYMKKKGLDTLTKERCSEIISKADDKIIARYTSLNWAQLLEPLFNLSDGQIDHGLLRLFFEDKKMPGIAANFDTMDQPVTRAKVIEVLSSPDSFNAEDFERDAPEPFDTRETEKANAEEQSPKNIVQKAPAESKRKEDDKTEPPRADSLPTGVDDDDSSNGAPIPTPLSNKSRESNAEFQHKESSLNTVFEDDFDSEEPNSELEQQAEEPQEEIGSSLNDNFEEAKQKEAEQAEGESSTNGVEAAGEDETEEPGFNEDQVLEIQEDESENIVDIKEEVKEETPMWQRFMGPEELQNFSEEEESTYDEGFVEEPLYDATTDEGMNEDELLALRDALEDKQAYFIEKIFRGSERAYDEALEEIAGKNNWRSASRYIQKEVFKRNLVDMYSEEAVDFTDRLHNYFIDKSDF